MKQHLTTNIHKKALATKEPDETENVKIEIEEKTDTEYDEEEEIGIDGDDMEDDGDEYLQDFNNDTFQTEPTKDELAEIKKETALLREKGKLEALKQKEANRFKKDMKKDKTGDEADDVFSKEGSEIIGKDKRLLLAKVLQYKTIFKKELSKFKVKKNATVEELKAYIDEMEVIVSIDSTEAFVMDGIFQALQMVEGVSAYTQNYDISGLSVMLRGNLQFQSVCKQLYVKYGTFAKCPPEGQLVFIVVTTAYICRTVNIKRKQAGLQPT